MVLRLNLILEGEGECSSAEGVKGGIGGKR